MNMTLSGLGANPKKIGVLIALLAVAGYFYFSNSTPSDSGASTAQRAKPGLPSITSPRVPLRQVSRNRLNQAKNFRNSGEFKPSLKLPKDFDAERSNIDPTLHLDLLAKLQRVKVEGGSRSVFDFGQAAPEPAKLAVKEPGKIEVARAHIGPMPPPPPSPPTPEEPPPAIPLKFYGFVAQSKPGQVKRAFFMDGEDIIVAGEGQTIKNRYKIVRIGINSAVVEDTQFKNHQQTLPLVQEITG